MASFTLKQHQDIPINICLLYLSYLPFRFEISEPAYEYGNFKEFNQPPNGKYFSIKTLENHLWFTMEHWMSKKYYTLILYPFSSCKFDWRTILFTFHILPSTGISSFWFAYFCGSIGGGIGKVIEYYYGYYMLYKNRKERQKKYNFEDIATKQMELIMSHDDYDSNKQYEKQSYNPHDYIDDKLLNKLYYVSNAKDPYIGSDRAVYGLIGYSFSLSIHYLYKQLKKFVKYKINYLDNFDNKNKNKQRNYKQIGMNIYHCFIVGFTSLHLWLCSVVYIQQLSEKHKGSGGYGYMSSGQGVFGIDLGAITALSSGMIAYPMVLNVKKIWKWKKITRNKLSSQNTVETK
eukprot:467576_1